MTFDGKRILITGASGGLGHDVVRSLAAAGAHCVLPSKPGEPVQIDGVDDSSITLAPRVDLTDEAAVESLYSDVGDLWASIHLVGGFAMAPIAETRLADLERMLDINVKSCFLCCREAVKAMRKTGDGGRIVNVSARPVLQPVGGMTAYVASKAAIAAITQGLAVELTDEGILVNAIVPSLIDTPTNRAAMPDADFSAWPRPAELAETIGFLASPKNRVTSGSLVPVYGRS